MDLRHGTLYRLLESLDENNERLGWNMYLNKRGRIIVKICYEEDTKLNSSEISDLPFRNVSYRRKTNKEIQRNHLRAKNFKENIQPTKRPRISSPEFPRQNLQNSSPIPNIDVTRCEEENSCVSEPSTHDLSASSPTATSYETKPVKPAAEYKSPPVTPEKAESINSPQKKSRPKHTDQSHRSDSKNKLEHKEHNSHSKSKKVSCRPANILDGMPRWGPDRLCTYGWCEVAQMRTGCICTAEIHPCTWCIDSELVISKMCSDCIED